MKVEPELEIERIVFSGCCHVNYLDAKVADRRRGDHKNIFCSVCGNTNHWPQKTDAEKAQEKIAKLERQIKEEQKKARFAPDENGRLMCPHCTKRVVDLRGHIKRKHPTKI